MFFFYENACVSKLKSSDKGSYGIVFGKTGFAIATDDERVDRVLAFVEEGSLADTANVPGMAYMVRRFKDVLAEDLDRYYSVSPRADEFMQTWTLGPCLKTQWHQAEPYNNNYKTPSSVCAETENGKYQASSTAVSVAQCIANYPQDYDIPVALLKKHNILQLVAQPKIYTWDTELAPKVAAFVKEFDPDKTTKFKCTGSSTEIADLSDVLNSLGFTGAIKINMILLWSLNVYVGIALPFTLD